MLLAHRQQHAMPNDADDVKGKWLSSVETGKHGVRLGSQLDRAQAQSMIESWLIRPWTSLSYCVVSYIQTLRRRGI